MSALPAARVVSHGAARDERRSAAARPRASARAAAAASPATVVDLARSSPARRRRHGIEDLVAGVELVLLHREAERVDARATSRLAPAPTRPARARRSTPSPRRAPRRVISQRAKNHHQTGRASRRWYSSRCAQRAEPSRRRPSRAAARAAPRARASSSSASGFLAQLGRRAPRDRDAELRLRLRLPLEQPVAQQRASRRQSSSL